MKSTESSRLTSGVGADRRVPTWAAGLISDLSRDLPTVLTREEILERLTNSRSKREIDATINELRRLGWLVGLPIHGVWAFIPAGQDELADPYLALRAWQARDPDAGFMLAGAAAAWHLGYLDRAPDRQTSIWLPATTRLPDGLRPYVSLVQIKWAPDAVILISPTTRLLLQRKLDIVSWASGLPAFGPEALIVQLAARPSSFLPWADLVAHLDQLVADCDDERLATLLADQSTSAWQRASYLLHAAGQPSRGLELLNQRPRRPMPKVKFHHARIDHGDPGVWIAEYHLLDRLVAPLQLVLGKA
jgi:hypothetical protein